jgi:hypothetical protein
VLSTLQGARALYFIGKLSRQFKAHAVRIEKVDAFENMMIGRRWNWPA